MQNMTMRRKGQVL